MLRVCGTCSWAPNICSSLPSWLALGRRERVSGWEALWIARATGSKFKDLAAPAVSGRRKRIGAAETGQRNLTHGHSDVSEYSIELARGATGFCTWPTTNARIVDDARRPYPRPDRTCRRASVRRAGRGAATGHSLTHRVPRASYAGIGASWVSRRTRACARGRAACAATTRSATACSASPTATLGVGERRCRDEKR
jgi:hypothetical protein